MNGWVIQSAAERFQDNVNLGPVTAALAEFVGVINRNSDGWPYWKAATTAASKLMDLIGDALKSNNITSPPSPAKLKAAITPIKSFCTKHKLPCPFVPKATAGLDVKTTSGRTFTEGQSAQLAYLIFLRFGENYEAALAAWWRLLQNNCTLGGFRSLVQAGQLLALS